MTKRDPEKGFAVQSTFLCLEGRGPRDTGGWWRVLYTINSLDSYFSYVKVLSKISKVKGIFFFFCFVYTSRAPQYDSQTTNCESTVIVDS